MDNDEKRRRLLLFEDATIPATFGCAAEFLGGDGREDVGRNSNEWLERVIRSSQMGSAGARRHQVEGLWIAAEDGAVNTSVAEVRVRGRGLQWDG